MEVRIDRIVVTPEGVWFGLVVTGPGGSWVKFAKVLLPTDIIPWRDFDMLRARADSTEPLEVDDPLWED